MLGVFLNRPTSLDYWLASRVTRAQIAESARQSAGTGVVVGAAVAVGGVALALTFHVAFAVVAVAGATVAVLQRRGQSDEPTHIQARREQADVIAAKVKELKRNEWRFEAMDTRAVDLLERAADRWRHMTHALRSPVWTHGSAADETADLRRAAQLALDDLMDDALVLAARCIGRETRSFKIPLLSRGFRHPHFEAIEASLRGVVDGVDRLAAEVDAAITTVAQTGTPRVLTRDLEALIDTLRARGAAARELRALEEE